MADCMLGASAGLVEVNYGGRYSQGNKTCLFRIGSCLEQGMLTTDLTVQTCSKHVDWEVILIKCCMVMTDTGSWLGH